MDTLDKNEVDLGTIHPSMVPPTYMNPNLFGIQSCMWCQKILWWRPKRRADNQRTAIGDFNESPNYPHFCVCEDCGPGMLCPKCIYRFEPAVKVNGKTFNEGYYLYRCPV